MKRRARKDELDHLGAYAKTVLDEWLLASEKHRRRWESAEVGRMNAAAGKASGSGSTASARAFSA